MKRRALSALLAAGLLLCLCSCDRESPPSSSAQETGAAASSLPSAAPPRDYSFDKEELPVYQPEFSVEAVIPGDPDFQPGSRYKGPVVHYRRDDSDPAAVTTWVWDSRVIIGKDPSTDMDGDLLLDMLIQNRVTDIYLGIHSESYMGMDELIETGGKVPEGKISEMLLRGYIKKCNRYGIRVALLHVSVGNAGIIRMLPDEDKREEYGWTKQQMLFIADFNSRAKGDDEKLYGLHIDLEANWDYGEGGAANVQHMADYLITMRRFGDAYGVEFGLDLLAHYFVRDAYEVTDETGARVNIVDVITKQCQSVAWMAYRRTASTQYDLVQLELPYAVKNGCQMLVASELGAPASLEDSVITYREMGLEVFSDQQKRLRAMLEDNGAKNYGIAIHCANSLYEMAMGL